MACNLDYVVNSLHEASHSCILSSEAGTSSLWSLPLAVISSASAVVCPLPFSLIDSMICVSHSDSSADILFSDVISQRNFEHRWLFSCQTWGESELICKIDSRRSRLVFVYIQ
ncbi:hypothetical protein EVAR_58467_1 [Eumeta japonica]|uniref:Uncharacterized protein n=1 Tax=Eumeta variegata TaxID=151549 RepID=A0A4C1YP12_EUMVA|nr:hypothetical protein EVAR_58467_1 [Eumeta japonica]